MKKRIALISEHASPLCSLGSVDSGGQNLYVAAVAKNLSALGYNVDVYTRRDNILLGESTEWISGRGRTGSVRVIHVPAGPASFVRKEELYPHMDDFASYMIRFIERHSLEYSIVHANFWMSGLVALRLKQVLGLPFVITFHALGRVRRIHQGENDQFPEVRHTIEDQLVAEADRIIAECPQDEEDLLRLYNADARRIGVVPCGFDPRELWPIEKEMARVVLGLKPKEKVLLQLGRMVPRKGVDNVIRALGMLHRSGRVKPTLLVVGGESERSSSAQDAPRSGTALELQRLRTIAKQEGVEDYVQFVGSKSRDVLKYYYSAADLFISTPWYEPFGITPVEAMACGTPVIGSNVGGIKFSVRDSETGYLVPPNDAEALAERIAELYQYPNIRRRFSERAVERANALFTWQRVTEQIVEAYEQAIAVTTAVDQSAVRDVAFLRPERLQKSRRTVPSASYPYPASRDTGNMGLRA